MRIVRKIEFKSEPYRVQFSGNPGKGKSLNLKTVQPKAVSLQQQKQLDELQNRLIQEGLSLIETKGVQFFKSELKDLSHKYQHELDVAIEKMADSVLSLSFEIASKLCRVEIAQNNTVVVEWVRDALNRIGVNKEVLVRVHPSEGDIIRKIKHDLLEEIRTIKELNVQDDAMIEPGGCLVEGDVMGVDATVPTRLAEIEKGLRPR